MPTTIARGARWSNLAARAGARSRSALTLSLAAVAAVAAVSAVSAPRVAAAAGPEKRECVAAYEDAQRHRKEGKLVSARERLLVCAQDGCPAIVRRDCTQWVGEVEQSTPTLVLEAIGADGRDLFEVTVSLDGKPLSERLDGKAVAVDPGPHVVVFDMRTGEHFEERVLAREGEKNRRVVVRVAPTRVAAAAGGGGAHADALGPPPTSRGRGSATPTSVYVFTGIGIGGLATFATFALIGTSLKDELDKKECKPKCNADDVKKAKTVFAVADVGLAIGAVSLAVAGVLHLARGDAEAPRAARLRVDVTPTPGGAAAVVGGTF